MTGLTKRDVEEILSALKIYHDQKAQLPNFFVKAIVEALLSSYKEAQLEFLKRLPIAAPNYVTLFTEAFTQKELSQPE